MIKIFNIGIEVNSRFLDNFFGIFTWSSEKKLNLTLLHIFLELWWWLDQSYNMVKGDVPRRCTNGSFYSHLIYFAFIKARASYLRYFTLLRLFLFLQCLVGCNTLSSLWRECEDHPLAIGEVNGIQQASLQKLADYPKYTP